MAKFTIEDVLKAYADKDLIPVIESYGVMPDRKGVWRPNDSRCCCALSALMCGNESPVFPTFNNYSAEVLGVDDPSFTAGFDGRSYQKRYVLEDYNLGRACREAVEAEYGALQCHQS